MSIYNKVISALGLMKKTDYRPQVTGIVRIPKLELDKAQTPYAPTQDKILDLVTYYRNKYDDYAFADLAKNTTIVRSIHDKVVLETFKSGFKITNDYVKKCKVCEKEYQTAIDSCNVCGSIDFYNPNDENKKILENIVESCNINNKSLKTELKTLCLDMLRYDEAFLQKIYEYYVEDKVMKKKFRFIQRATPTQIMPLISSVGVMGVDQTGSALGFCPMHRNTIHDLNKVKFCPQCAKQYKIENPLYTADYYSLISEKANDKIYYNRSEIIRLSLFEQSSRYSMISTLSDKITSLLAIDQLINDVYVNRRYVNRAVFFNISDIRSIQESDQYNADQLKKDKSFVPKYATGANTTGEFVKVIDMLGTIEELKLIELQDKYEKDICQAYNAIIDPTTRAITIDPSFIKDIQADINAFILKEITKALKITDWTLELRDSQTADEANDLRLAGLKIQNAMGKINLGFELKGYNKDTNDYIFEDIPTEQPGRTNFSSFSSNSRGLENTFGILPGTEDLSDKKE